MQTIRGIIEMKLIDITDLDIFSMADEDIVSEIKRRELIEAIPIRWLKKRV